MLPDHIAAWITGLRQSAAVGGTGWIVIRTRTAGAITVMYREIAAEPDDDALMALIQARCKAEQEQQPDSIT